MPSDKFVRAPMWRALALALGLGLASLQVDAAGLGRLSVQSGLGQPLRAELEVTSVGRDEAPTLAVRLAPLSAFRAANLEFNPALTNVRFGLERRADGSYFVRITSPQPVNEPYLDMMVELTWATGRVIREYTVLLDPPALKGTPDVVAPATPVAPPAVAAAPLPRPTPVTPPVTAPAPVAQAPAPAPAGSVPLPPPLDRPAAAPAAAAPAAPAAPSAPTTAGGSYVVKSGDTLGRIANQNRGAASLDQMLVALFRANPDAFVGNNMNRLKAGATLAIPTDADAAAVTAPEARREVAAQSADFAAYRSRLAQAAGAAPVAAAPAAAAGGGRVTTQVEDKSATAAKGGDQLKIARADEKGAAAAAAAKADEAAAKARAIKEEQERAAQLKATNDAIQKAIEVQSKAGTQAQKAAEEKKGAPPVAAAPAAPPAPAATATPPAPPPVAQATPAPAPAPVEPPKMEAPKTEPPAAAAPPPAAPPAAAPKKAAPPPPAPVEEPSFISDLLGNTTTQLGLAGIVALLAGLFGWSWFRKRKAEKDGKFKDTEGGLQANSLFGATGGQSVDTGTSTFNSSFIPAASQLDSNEVDPVAEADVYIAYGREEQAEDILKEALRMQPDRHAVRVKLLEIYSRRGDRAAFMTLAEDLRDRTGGAGEDWDKAVKLGHAVDPTNPMFSGGAGPDTTGRGPTTAFRIDPNTKGRGPSTLGGTPTAGLDLGGLRGADSVLQTGSDAPPLTKMVVDTRMTGADTTMSTGDTKMPADTKMSGPNTTSAPTTQFQATLPSGPATRGGPPTKGGLTPPTAPAEPDFASLDFDLGPTKMNLNPPTKMPTVEAAAAKVSDVDFGFKPTKNPVGRTEPPALADLDIGLPKMPDLQPTATGAGLIPDLDLNIPSPKPAAAAAAAAEALSRPTVIGKKTPVTADVGALPDEQAARLTANTDQATVPLIDFDLSAVSLNPTTKRGETEPGSALAQQMATKLDLARGYIDLGVKDGARELLDEVMRDGTREQRQAAVELIKQIEG
jgi:pilus assembly protein FimV